MPGEFPDITKQGHSETRTSFVSSAAIANVTEGSPFALLYQCTRILSNEPLKTKSGMYEKLTCGARVPHERHPPSWSNNVIPSQILVKGS